MNILELLKKIFVPSYTDRGVDSISAANQRRMKQVTRELKSHNKVLAEADVALSIFLATRGKHGN